MPLSQAPYLDRQLLEDVWSWLWRRSLLFFLFLLDEDIAIHTLVLLWHYAVLEWVQHVCHMRPL